MRILFDQGTPAPLRRFLALHAVSTAYEMGWAELKNGDLLAAAEKDFDAFITTDKNLLYQQNLTGRQLAILVLSTTNWPEIQKHLGPVSAAVNALKPGDLIELVLDCKNKRYSRQAIWAAGAARARSIPAAGCDERATKPAAQRANGYIAYFCNQALEF